MDDIRESLAAFADHCGEPAVLFCATVNEGALVPLYECLRELGDLDRLNLVLITQGGSVTIARRAALLLRDRAGHLTISVPYLARSAGTLICLAANDLMLGPMAELGPIDGHLGPNGPPPEGTPGLIAAEDVRSFPVMARDWFGVREEDALQVLALVAQRVFPTTLTQFYRADRYIRTAAEELLRFPFPDRDEAARTRIVDALVAGRGDHDDRITRHEAEALGLRMRHPSPAAQAHLWELWRGCTEARGAGATGVIAGGTFLAREVADWVGEGERRQPRVRWETQE